MPFPNLELIQEGSIAKKSIRRTHARERKTFIQKFHH
jgi:hypothetical protein